MRTMAAKLVSSKPISWIKKHWMKVVIAIIVIYAIYWLFIEDPDVEHLTSVEVSALKKAMDDAKIAWDAAVKAEADVKAGTLADPKCSSPAVTPSSTLGCSAYTSAKKAAYDTAKAAYDPYAPKEKSKKKKSLKSRIRGWFRMKK